MDIEELRSVQTRERATDGLQDLRDSFYEDVAAYLQSLREERDAAAAEAEDPFRSPTVNELTDEIETAERVVEAIYERRIGKLVKQASLAAAGMPDDQQGLTTEEQELYDVLVERIEENKAAVLGSLSGERPSDTKEMEEGSERKPDPTPGGDRDPTTGGRSPGPEGSESVATADDEVDSEGNDDPEDPETDVAGEEDADATTIERTRVRVTEDVGEIFGVDERAYTLAADDVVHLPTENAEPLVERDAAERLE